MDSKAKAENDHTIVIFIIVSLCCLQLEEGSLTLDEGCRHVKDNLKDMIKTEIY